MIKFQESQYSKLPTELYQKYLSTLLSNIFVYPLIRIQSILQVQQTYKQLKTKFTTLTLTRDIYRRQGLFSYYRGFTSFIYKGFTTITIMELFSQGLRKLLDVQKSQQKYNYVLLSSAVFANLIAYPYQITLLRFQLDIRQKYTDPIFSKRFECLKQIYKIEGLKAIYRGLGLSLFQNVSIILLSKHIYNQFQKLFQSNPQYINAISACMISQIILYPIDSIKKKIQISGGINHRKLYSSVKNCIKDVYRQQKLRGFMRGLHLRCISTPLIGIFYLSNSMSFQQI